MVSESHSGQSQSLPTPISEIDSECRQLILDYHLSRADLVQMIGDELGIAPENNKEFSKTDVIEIYRTLGLSNEPKNHIRSKRLKTEIQREILDHLGIDGVSEFSGKRFSKSDLIAILISLKTESGPDGIASNKGTRADQTSSRFKRRRRADS